MSSPSYVPDDAEDVTDHGGTLGTGVSRSTAESNAQAVEDASAASSGANVYIPAGTLEFAGNFPILFGDGYDGAAGASIYGDGPETTFLKTNKNHSEDEQPEIWYRGSSSDHGTITWEELTLDGNTNLDSFSDLAGRQRGINFKDGNSANKVVFENFRIQHMVYAATSFSSSFPGLDGEINRFTAYDIAIGLLKQSDGSSIDHVFSGSNVVDAGNKFTITNSEFELVAGTVVDTGDTGEIEFNNCYAEGIGDAFLKSGSILGTIKLINLHLVSGTQALYDANSGLSTQFRGRGLAQRQNSGSSEEKIRFDNVKVDNASEYIFFIGDGKFDIAQIDSGGPLAAVNFKTDDNPEFGNFGAFRHTGSTSGHVVDIEDISIHGDSGMTIFDIDSGSGSTTEFRRESGSKLGGTDGISIGTDNPGGTPYEPTVPEKTDVGINSTGSTDDGGSEDDTTSSSEPVFEEWTPRWNSTQDDWSVVSDSGYAGDSALVFEHDGDDRTLYGISWDAAGEHSDVEVLDRFRVPTFNPEDGLGFHARVHLRSSTVDGTRQGYWIEIEDREDAFRLGRYTADGDLATLGHFGTPKEDTLYNRRFRAESDQIKAKVWPAAEAEPDGWDIEVTDDVVSSGWVGLGSYDPGRVETDLFSVATDGGTAQFVHGDSAPSVTWASPTGDTVLSGEVPVQIGASDAEDTDDTLLVEYQIDDGPWAAASYNPDTGYYEGSWDSTAVTDGDHTLTASVTDSAGNTSETAVTVTTDNSGTRPTVDSLSLEEVETADADAEFDAAWQVGDADGNLETVDLVLAQADGTTEDTATVSVSGGTASGATRLVAPDGDGSGADYTVELTATDSKANTATDTASTSEFEDTGSAPTVSRFSVSEAGRPDPHAEITAVWDVSDADGDLAAVDIDVADSTGTVQSVNWSLFGSTASDTDTFRLKGGDGKTFEVTLTVTDSAGQTATATRTVTA